MRPSNSSAGRVLIADDQPDVREALRLLLKGEGYETQAVSSPADLLTTLETRDFDAVLMDLNYARDTTSGEEGLDLLARIQALDGRLPVVVMTAWGSVPLAVEAMRRGARDFVQKPWENARLLTILRTQIELRQALRRASRLEAENRLLRAEARPTLIAESQAMRAVLELIARVGPSDANVLICGEHGTGKEVVAHTLHALSPRAAKPMVTVNAGGLSEGVFESELFGHVKGAFTGAVSPRQGRFAQADGGTLFLDEIGDMPMALQAKILRVLQERSFEPVGSANSRSTDVRILAATNKDLREAVRSGGFRSDLYYRLNVFPIDVPPLRARREDIPLLVEHSAHELAQHMGKPQPSFTQAALRAMQDYAWPGNVRELQNCIERAIIVAKGNSVDVGDLPQDLFTQSPGSHEAVRIPSSLDAELERLEREFILEALRRTAGIQVKAAELLGVSERSLWHRVKKLGISIAKRATT